LNSLIGLSLEVLGAPVLLRFGFEIMLGSFRLLNSTAFFMFGHLVFSETARLLTLIMLTAELVGDTKM
jgi:hypothetical protein